MPAEFPEVDGWPDETPIQRASKPEYLDVEVKLRDQPANKIRVVAAGLTKTDAGNLRAWLNKREGISARTTGRDDQLKRFGFEPHKFIEGKKHIVLARFTDVGSVMNSSGIDFRKLDESIGRKRPEWPNQIRNVEDMKVGMRIEYHHLRNGQVDVWEVIPKQEGRWVTPEDNDPELWFWAVQVPPSAMYPGPEPKSFRDCSVAPYADGTWNQWNYITFAEAVA